MLSPSRRRSTETSNVSNSAINEVRTHPPVLDDDLVDIKENTEQEKHTLRFETLFV